MCSQSLFFSKKKSPFKTAVNHFQTPVCFSNLNETHLLKKGGLITKLVRFPGGFGLREGVRGFKWGFEQNPFWFKPLLKTFREVLLQTRSAISSCRHFFTESTKPRFPVRWFHSAAIIGNNLGAPVFPIRLRAPVNPVLNRHHLPHPFVVGSVDRFASCPTAGPRVACCPVIPLSSAHTPNHHQLQWLVVSCGPRCALDCCSPFFRSTGNKGDHHREKWPRAVVHSRDSPAFQQREATPLAVPSCSNDASQYPMGLHGSRF